MQFLNRTTLGVNNNEGELNGYAWSSHAGWINFNPTYGGVSINETTGEFSGYAWSENIGWIKFAGTAQDDSTTYMVKTSTSATGSLQVTIEPEGARTAGAQWRRVGTSIWRDSGDTETGVPAGEHIVEYSEISGWTRPANQSVAITAGETTTATGTYTTVAIHTVTPSAGTGGSVSPASRNVNNGQTTTFTVTANPGFIRDDTVGGTCPAGSWSGEVWTTGAITANCTVSFSFTASGGTGSLQVFIEPEGARTAGAQWRRAGTEAWLDSGHTETDLEAGAYVVEFSVVQGWTRPPSQDATVTANATTLVTGVYSRFAPGELKWRYKAGGEDDDYVRSSPALSADGAAVYFGSNDGRIHALDTATGVPLWTFATGGPVRSSPALGSGGMLYVGSNDGQVYALTANTGATRWNQATGGYVWSSPGVAGAEGEVVVFGGNSGVLFAHSRDGAQLWATGLGSEIMSSPAVRGGWVYVGTDDGRLHALDLYAGMPKPGFPYQTTWILFSSPAVDADGVVYAVSSEGRIHAIGPDGILRWTLPLGLTFVFSSPALGTQNLYIGCNEGRLYAVRMADGALQWTMQTNGAIMSSPAVDAAGTIYVGSYDGSLYAVNDNGDHASIRWSYPTGGPIFASPNVGPDGTIYVGSHDGYFYAIQGEGPLAGTAWPKFRRDAQNTGDLP